MSHKRNEDNLNDRLAAIVREQFNLKEDIKLAQRCSLRTDLKMDSLDLVELVMELEDEFSILIEDEEAIKWTIYGDLQQAIKNHVKLLFAMVTTDDVMRVTSVSNKGDYGMEHNCDDFYPLTWKTSGGAQAAMKRIHDLISVSKGQLKIIEVVPWR